MDYVSTLDEVRQKAEVSLRRLRRLSAEDFAIMKTQVENLRDARQYDLMSKLAEAICRHDPEDAKNRRLYAQCLIELGNVTAAIDVLKALRARPNLKPSEYVEAGGLLGRAYKQIFLELSDKASPEARDALKNAIASYREPYEADPALTWHGVNLVALLKHARRLDISVGSDLDPLVIAGKIVATLLTVPDDKRDDWHSATLAEAHLGLGDWDAVEREIKAYAAGERTKAFLVAGTLRQLTDIWGLDSGNDLRGRSIVAALRARLLQLENQDLRLTPSDVTELRSFEPQRATLEAVLGKDGPKTYEWMRRGLERAAAVASIRLKDFGRVGTGFLVRAGDFGLEPPDDLLVLTNWHVVNPLGLSPGIRPEEAEVIFEAADTAKRYNIASVVWTRPVARHDATFLKLEGEVTKIEPMPLARDLPVVEEAARVYVIGYPGGRELSVSLQDNQLLDHEGPPNSNSLVPGVCRVHYRTPTERGSSGSPVFDAKMWHVIALHHAGSERPVPMLNGKTGTYLANEGISTLSIKAEIETSKS
ncbi:hypothetical protein GCM10007874_00220 [Labrys miyagiensis]|uniref:Serine protease n=1 Tax=Labrys miyagiensis TaxID=346912 RepID=A0ABQ6CFJ4_9HYPH|nr:TRAFs-binding domain-containing protein [Labrys miyagiensis]GLS17007.1 hypothetical protein GCM10007874_00220 [Labrys miyagiensis]